MNWEDKVHRVEGPINVRNDAVSFTVFSPEMAARVFAQVSGTVIVICCNMETGTFAVCWNYAQAYDFYLPEMEVRCIKRIDEKGRGRWWMLQYNAYLPEHLYYPNYGVVSAASDNGVLVPQEVIFTRLSDKAIKITKELEEQMAKAANKFQSMGVSSGPFSGAYPSSIPALPGTAVTLPSGQKATINQVSQHGGIVSFEQAAPDGDVTGYQRVGGYSMKDAFEQLSEEGVISRTMRNAIYKP